MGKHNGSGYAWLIVVLLSFVLVAPSLAAQSTSTGALTGTVTDATGAVVPNATVTVTSADTGQMRTTTTSANGSYSVGLLPPGVYHVRFAAAGFKESEVPSAVVAVTETATLNQALEVGSQAEKVTVQGEVETVQTSNATVGTVMTSQTVTIASLDHAQLYEPSGLVCRSQRWRLQRRHDRARDAGHLRERFVSEPE